MASTFNSIDQIIDYEETDTFTEQMFNTIFLKFHAFSCTLKEEIAQFREGTKITYLTINNCLVGNLYIRDDKVKNYGEPPGYHYRFLLNFEAMKDDKSHQYSELFGYHGLFYKTEGTKMITKAYGFKFTDCVDHDKRHIYKLKLDFVNSIIVADDLEIPIKIQIRLDPRAIRTKFINSEYLKGNIDKSDFSRVAISSSLKERWDVRMPKDYIEDKLEDLTQEARRKFYKYDGDEDLKRDGSFKVNEFEDCQI